MGGGYTKQNLNYLEQGNMGVFIGQGDHDYCGVLSRNSEQGSRFSVQNCEGFKRVEVKTADISIHLPKMGKTRYRPSCITRISPGSNLHVMETRSFQQRQGCISDLLDTPKKVRFSPILIERSCIKQSSIRTSSSDLSNLAWQASTMVSKTITNVCENTSAAPKGSRTFIRSEQENLQGSLQLLACMVSGKNYVQKEFQTNLPLLSQMQSGHVHTLITNWPGVSGVVGVLRD